MGDAIVSDVDYGGVGHIRLLEGIYAAGVPALGIDIELRLEVVDKVEEGGFLYQADLIFGGRGLCEELLVSCRVRGAPCGRLGEGGACAAACTESQYCESLYILVYLHVLFFQFVLAVEEIDVGGRVVEDLFGAEEATDFDGSVLYAVGGVHDICLSAHAEVAAESARSGIAAVGDAGHGAEDADHIHAFQTHYYYGGRRHRSDDRGEEGLVDEMRVVFAKNRLIKLHHLHAGDDEASFLYTTYDLSDQPALHSRGLQYDECLFHEFL